MPITALKQQFEEQFQQTVCTSLVDQFIAEFTKGLTESRWANIDLSCLKSNQLCGPKPEHAHLFD